MTIKLQDFEVGKVYVKKCEHNDWIYKVDNYGDYHTKIKGVKYAWSDFIINKTAMLSEFEEYSPKPKLLSDLKIGDKCYRIMPDGSIEKIESDGEYDDYSINNNIRPTEKSAEKEVLFQQYLAKLYMACEEDSYNEPSYENQMYEVFYSTDSMRQGLTPKLWKIKNFYPKQYRFKTYESAQTFCYENKELAQKVFSD